MREIEILNNILGYNDMMNIIQKTRHKAVNCNMELFKIIIMILWGILFWYAFSS